jgi:hypothetical protein
MWVLIYGAVGLLVMPTAYRLVGMNGVLWFFALFPAVALPFVRYLPVSGDQVAPVHVGLGLGSEGRSFPAVISQKVTCGEMAPAEPLGELDGLGTFPDPRGPQQYDDHRLTRERFTCSAGGPASSPGPSS